MSRASNGQAWKQRQKLQEQQSKQQQEQQTLQAAFNADDELDRGWMKEILETDDLEEKLQPWTIPKIQAMLNKQWVLSNLTDAETHDHVHKLGVMKIKVFGEHPPSESEITGAVRAYVMDDESERLMPLTPQERNTIDQLIMTLQMMVTRSRDGFERKQINTNIARTESESSTDTEQKSGLRGLLSR
jgi:hypothetical protein